MTKILIEDIEKEPNKTMFYEFIEFMEEFGADITADIELKSLGQFIEISGTAQGNLKLICDRCLQEFDYELPEELIAQRPSEKRENSKMMVLNRALQEISHKNFFNIVDYFSNHFELLQY